MIELSPGHSSAVLPLLRQVPFNTLFAQVVAMGLNPGHVYADNTDSPSVCLVTHDYGMSFLTGGIPGRIELQWLSDFLKSGRTRWMLVWPEKWHDVLNNLSEAGLYDMTAGYDPVLFNTLTANRTVVTLRQNFSFDRAGFPGIIDAPSGFTLEPLSPDWFDRISGTVVPRRFWNSRDEYARKGSGYVMHHNGNFVSCCFACYNVGSLSELGIETAAAYRGRQLGGYTARAMVHHCLEHGLTPVWGCRAENTASARIAESAGFIRTTLHPYYNLPKFS